MKVESVKKKNKPLYTPKIEIEVFKAGKDRINKELIIGWDQIAGVLGTSVRSAIRERPNLLRAGVIFYRLRGFPPKKRVMSYRPYLERYQLQKK